MKIAFFSSDPGNHRFIEPIIRKLRGDGIECQLYLNWTIDDSADVYWFDFADNNLIQATAHNKEELKDKTVIARLHAVEYYMNFHQQIDWGCVDHLIFVSEHMKEKCGKLPVKTHVIHNGIDIDTLEFKDRDPKSCVLGYAGNIVPTKGILTMFHYFKELLNYIPHAQLRMVGLNRFSGREGEYYNYYRNLLGTSIRENPEVDNINTWLDGIDCLWQPSLAESFSLIVGEAMAKGIKPIVNEFSGSRELWPDYSIYNDFSSFKRIIDAPHESKRYREFVEQYSLDNQMKKINEILSTQKS